jgi:hypothetical protein
MSRLLDKGRPIIQAKRIDDSTASSRRFANRPDIDAAPAAQQVIRSAGTKAVFLHKRPICP